LGHLDIRVVLSRTQAALDSERGAEEIAPLRPAYGHRPAEPITYDVGVAQGPRQQDLVDAVSRVAAQTEVVARGVEERGDRSQVK
jgi:hypothetical protein